MTTVSTFVMLMASFDPALMARTAASLAVAWGAVTIKNLFDNLVRYQTELPYRLKIVDETGIKSVPDREGDWGSVAVSRENPTWSGERSVEMAREWFEEQFGVTFTEGVRPVAVCVVRRAE